MKFFELNKGSVTLFHAVMLDFDYFMQDRFSTNFNDESYHNIILSVLCMCVRIVRQRLEECIIDLLSQQSMGTDGAQIQPYGSGVEEGGGQEATGPVIYYNCFCDDRAGLPPAARGGQHGMLEIPNYAKVTYPHP